MANTLFNDAVLNVKINQAGVSASGSTRNNIADMLDVDDDPAVNNGILIYNTANSTYTLASIPQGAFIEYEFTAANGQTNFAGNDNNSASLNDRTSDSIKVYLNGILLEHTEDYTATNGANVVLTSGTSNNDVVQIHSFNIFSSNNISVASNNNIGVANSNPAHLFSVNGETYFGANVHINGTMVDDSNRALKVYYANGDVAWGQ